MPASMPAATASSAAKTSLMTASLIPSCSATAISTMLLSAARCDSAGTDANATLAASAMTAFCGRAMSQAATPFKALPRTNQ